MTEARRIDEGQDLLAAELAFGLVDDSDRAHAEALRASDPEFATAVRRWEAVGIDDMVALDPIKPPTALWERIAAQTAADTVVVPFERMSQDNGMARRLSYWRGGALVSGAVAASLAMVMILGRPTPAPDDPVVVATASQLATVQVVDSENEAIATAVFDQAAGTMRIRLDINDTDGDAAIVPEFWIIPADGTPRSLGRASAGAIRLTPEQQRLVFAGGSFAVSLEPDDGVVSEAPRGTVLGAAPIQML
jgi:anti-sigma-K factor RskA